MLNEERLIKSGVVEKRSLPDEHIRSITGTLVFYFDSFSPLVCFT